VGKVVFGVWACDGVVVAEAGDDCSCGVQSASHVCIFLTVDTKHLTFKKLAELRLNIRSASLIGAFRRVAAPAPPAAAVVAAPLM
jgi:hypothetical protein